MFALMTELLKIHQRLRTLSIVKELMALWPQTVFFGVKKNRLLLLGGFRFQPPQQRSGR